MKKKLFILILFTSSFSFAQSDFVAAGSDGIASTGSISFSVGQAAFYYASNTSGNINQGVQQPIEIFELSNLEFEDQSFNALLYPNPAVTSVTLSLSSVNPNSKLEYNLTDVTGKIIRSGRITSVETIIDVIGLAQACYYLNVKTSNKIIKTFKLLKNE